MERDEKDQNSKIESTPVLGRKPNGKSQINAEISVTPPVVTCLCTRRALLMAIDYGNGLKAAIRTFLLTANTVGMAFTSSKKRDAFGYSKAGIAMVQDFYLGRFGAPARLK
jgi:hypothetical protein